MQYRTLGSTGVGVSALGLGGFHIGVPDERQGVEIIRAAIEGGITFMDNCWDYHDGASEIRMGKALEGGYREQVFLMSKIDGRTYDAAAAQIDESLARLRTDVIDLMQIHEVIRLEDPDRLFAAGGAMEALRAARDDGRVRFLGFTGHKNPLVHERMLDAAEANGVVFDAVQMPLNVFDAHFRSFEKAVLPRLIERGIGVLGMKPMGAGRIPGSGVASAEECLRYALSLPVSTVITGIDSMAVLEQDLAVERTFEPLTASERDKLLAQTAEAAAAGAHEGYKTGASFDGTALNPHWMGAAERGA
ncbi:MAG: aldo/keto reductase [Coriobacteriia bacterium]